jgi:hypothetical protein
MRPITVTNSILKCREEQARCLQDLQEAPTKSAQWGAGLGLEDWFLAEVDIIYGIWRKDGE